MRFQVVKMCTAITLHSVFVYFAANERLERAHERLLDGRDGLRFFRAGAGG